MEKWRNFTPTFWNWRIRRTRAKTPAPSFPRPSCESRFRFERRSQMSIWRPDPTFYPSPKMAMDAPPEKLAYVAMVNGKNNGRHDALGVIDVDPESSLYGKLVGQVDMPNAGDELHHF